MDEGCGLSHFLGDIRVIISLAAVVVVLLWYYSTYTFNFWKKRGIPDYPIKPIPFFGHTFSILTGRKNFSYLFDEMYKTLGNKPFAGIFHGSQPCLLVTDLDLLKDIFIKDFHSFMDRGFSLDEDIDPLNAKGLFNLKGQRWKDMRARLSPTFTSGRMKAMFPLMLSCADELGRSLKTDIDKNGGEATFEAKELMSCFTIDVIATCAFGIRCDALQNPETSEFRKMGKLTFQLSWKRRIVFMLLLIFPRVLKMLRLKFTDDETSTFFRNFVKDMMEKREADIEKDSGNSKGYGDFIYHLMLLKKRGLHYDELKDDDEDDLTKKSEKEKNENEEIKEVPSWTNVTLDDLTAQAMQFFGAGFETTSSLLSFSLFELSSSERGKEIQRQLREEVDRVMEEDGGKLTYNGLKKMQLLDRILNEVLRLYPPVSILSRITTQPYTIPGTNIKLEKDTQLFIPIQAMQHDEKYFPNPSKFDPDRFLPDNKDQMNQFTYLPFGDGPRICIGQRFAQLQAKVGLASLISKFEFDLCHEKTKSPLVFSKLAFILTIEGGIWIKAKLRDRKKV